MHEYQFRGMFYAGKTNGVSGKLHSLSMKYGKEFRNKYRKEHGKLDLPVFAESGRNGKDSSGNFELSKRIAEL